jgi:type VI protein secretion system component VasF
MKVRIRRAAATVLEVRMTQSTRLLLWAMLAVLAAVVAYLGFRGYFSPELLFNFSNAFSC